MSNLTINHFSFKYILISICALTFSGCAVNKGTINSFYEPSYIKGSVKSLAVPSLRNARLAPAASQQIGRSVNTAIANHNPNVKMLSANKFNRLLNELGLVDEYSDFIKDYVTSGIANREFLEQIQSHGIDAIMLSELSNAYQQDGTYGSTFGKTRVTLTFSILDTRTNDVIWTASADGIKGTATTVGDAPALIEAIDIAVDKIKTVVPKL